MRSGIVALVWLAACASQTSRDVDGHRTQPAAATKRDTGVASDSQRTGSATDRDAGQGASHSGANAAGNSGRSATERPTHAAGASGSHTLPPDADGGDAGSAAPGNADASTPGAESAPRLTLQYSEYLGQLTGQPPNALTALGMHGTDLGVSFQRGDRLYFLFGDTWGPDASDVNRDSIAWAPTAARPGAIPRLTWLTRADGRFLPLRVDGIDLGGMNVPVEGVTIGTRTYLFFDTGWSDATQRASTSVLAHADGDAFGALALDHASLSVKFLNVSVIRKGEELWIWGSGPYRKSPVYLAHARTDRVADRTSWTYYRAGAELGPDEATAQPLIAADCVGELSAREHGGRYFLAYNCGGPPRGIWLRVASSPVGPWSEPVLIYEPPQGYEHFIHAQQSAAGHDDGLSERGRENEWGGEYGPYLIPSWFTEPKPGLQAVVYTLSSWNPYQAHLLRTVLAEPGVTADKPNPGADLPHAAVQNPSFTDGALTGWHAQGDTFRTFRDDADGGQWALTTFADAQDATRGKLWQDLTIDAQTTSLQFKLHGGHASVALYAGDVVVRRSRGRDDNGARVPVVWNLETLRGRTVRLVIEDDLDEPWGFVSVSGFELH